MLRFLWREFGPAIKWTVAWCLFVAVVLRIGGYW